MKIFLYIITSFIIILIIYYLPDYSLLERAIADQSTLLLNAIGIHVESKTIGNRAYIDGIRIVKDCTGIQVIAVFLGLLIPLPKASLKKKALTLIIISGLLYLSNLLRVVLEFYLNYFNILSWNLIHYPLSLLLGILGVFILTYVTDYLLPEFGNFISQNTKEYFDI